MKRHLIPLLVILIAVVVAQPLRAVVVPIDGVWYELDEQKHTAAVTCNDALRRDGLPTYSEAVAVEVPAVLELEGKKYKVVAVSDYAFYGAQVTTVRLPEGVANIGIVAFADCPNLESVTLPGTVTRIGEMAFARCGRLQSAAVPDKVKIIEPQLFYECASLRELTIGKGVTRIGDGAFAGCKALETVTLPDGVTHLGLQVFRGCSALKSVSLGKKLLQMDEAVFFVRVTRRCAWSAMPCAASNFR